MNVAKYIEARSACEAGDPGVHRFEHTPDGRGHDIDEEAADPIFEPVGDAGALALVEMILKDRPRLERVIRDPWANGRVSPRFLAIALSGFTLFGVSMVVVLAGAGLWPRLSSLGTWLAQPQQPLIRFEALGEGWGGAASAVHLVVAYSVGLVAASCICLPSLYFFGLLSGVRLTMLDVAVHTLKAKASAAIALVGILPLYVAVCMGMLIFGADRALTIPTLWLGLLLPFIAGLWGTRSLYVGFASVCDTMREPQRQRRACFLRRLVLSWCVLYTAVAPVTIHALWTYLDA